MKFHALLNGIQKSKALAWATLCNLFRSIDRLVHLLKGLHVTVLNSMSFIPGTFTCLHKNKFPVICVLLQSLDCTLMLALLQVTLMLKEKGLIHGMQTLHFGSITNVI